MMMKNYLKMLMLLLLPGLVPLAHADPKAGLWEVTNQFHQRKNNTHVGKYKVCIQQNRTWYIPYSAKVNKLNIKSMGTKGTWSSDGASNLLIGINPNSTKAAMYALENEGTEKMNGVFFYYYIRTYKPESPATHLAEVHFTFKQATCQPLTY